MVQKLFNLSYFFPIQYWRNSYLLLKRFAALRWKSWKKISTVLLGLFVQNKVLNENIEKSMYAMPILKFFSKWAWQKKDQSRIINFIDQMNSIQVTNFHDRSTVPLNYQIYARPQSSKKGRRSEFYKYTKLPVTRWVKLSLNFELLVNRVMKFLLGQRLFNNNIFCTTWIIPYPKNNNATELFD